MCERELETEQNCNILTPTLISHNSVSFPFSWAAQPGAWGPASMVLGPHYSIFSPTATAQSGVLRAPSARCWFSLPYLSPTHSNFLCTELYYCFTPTQSLPITGQRNMQLPPFWNGMFDHHRAEIAVMQLTGHPLPVHQFVTAPWDFNPVPYCQPSSPMQPLPITGQRNMQLLPSLEWHVWPGRGSIYNIMSFPQWWDIPKEKLFFYSSHAPRVKNRVDWKWLERFSSLD